MMSHPCRSCGACCAFFRVEFYWREANAEDVKKPVPQTLVEPSGPHKLSMKGTNQNHHIRCIALEGRVGQNVRCKIYESRSSPCRSFSASYENGEHNARCDLARRGYGLAPLTSQDWEIPAAMANL